MTEKIRKRSFTNYQNSPDLEQSLLNLVLEESMREGSQNNLPECQNSPKDYKISTIGFAKSKKAKILNKFEKFQDRTARQSTQNGNISTIASLKKHIASLECDQIMSFRHNIKKVQENSSSQPRQKQQSQSEIAAIIRKFDQIKKQSMTDKYRRKFLLFNTMKMKTQVKTQRSSGKSDRISTQSEHVEVSQRKLNLNFNLSTKNFKCKRPMKQESFQYRKSRSSMSLTARKFYERKGKEQRNMTTSCYDIYDRQRSIKKILIGKKGMKDISQSVTTL